MLHCRQQWRRLSDFGCKHWGAVCQHLESWLSCCFWQTTEGNWIPSNWCKIFKPEMKKKKKKAWLFFLVGKSYQGFAEINSLEKGPSVCLEVAVEVVAPWGLHAPVSVSSSKTWRFYSIVTNGKWIKPDLGSLLRELKVPLLFSSIPEEEEKKTDWLFVSRASLSVGWTGNRSVCCLSSRSSLVKHKGWLTQDFLMELQQLLCLLSWPLLGAGWLLSVLEQARTNPARDSTPEAHLKRLKGQVLLESN